MSQFARSAAFLLSAAVLVPLTAQVTAPTAAPASPAASAALTPAAQGYAEFELGKWAELQAENTQGDQSSTYIGQALRHYTAAMAANPQSAYIASQMADLLSRIGRTADATTLAQSVVKAHPASLAAHQTLGSIYLRQLGAARQPITGTLMDEAIAEYKTLLQLAPTNTGNRVILGKLYGAQGQPAQAEQEFRTALASDPTNLDALSSLIQSLAGQNHLDQAEQEIASLPQAARSGQVYATLGDAYLNQHRYAQAAAAFRQAVQARPDDPDFQSALAQALMDGDDYPQALDEYQRLLRETPQDGHAALRVAQLQMQMDQLDAASASLKTAAGLLPSDDIEVAYATALLQQSQGNDPAALTSLRALVARKTRPATQSIFLDQLSRLEMRTGDYAGALASLHTMEALGGTYVARAHALEIEVFSDQRDFTQALAAARAALADAPESRSLHITYANLLAASGQTDQALGAVQPLMKGTPADWDLYLAEGQIHMAAQQWPLALASTQRADQLAPTPADHARAVSQLGSIQARQKDFAAAEQSYRRALLLEPHNPATLNALGYLLAQQGVRLPEALGYVQQAVARDANNGAYLDSLGWVYFKMNRLPDAVASLERAAKLERHDPAILDHLAQAYSRDGKLQQAESSWTEALADLKLRPADAERAQQIQKNLDAVKIRIAQGNH